MPSEINEAGETTAYKMGLIMILTSLILVRGSEALLLSDLYSAYLSYYFFIILVSALGIIASIKISLDKAILISLVPGFMELFIGLDKLISLMYLLKQYSVIDIAFSFIIFASMLVITASLKGIWRQSEVSASTLISDSSREYPYAVELIDVIKDYVVGPYVVHALRGVTMRVKKGEFVAIMGPSGSGKSTLLNMIGAIDRPTAGKVLVDGIDISELDDNELAELRNKKIGFVFQAYNLINRTTVLRNVELPAIVSGMPKSKRIERAKELLALVGLREEIHRSPKYLSGGQQQRVAIARALMNNPSLILADEPTGNLDSKSGKEVMLYLRKLNEEFGTTIIVVTHDRSVAEMADRILYIKDGKIIGEEILRNGERYEK